MTIVRLFYAYAASVVVTTLFGSIAHTQMVLARLTGAGAEVSFAMRLQTTFGDFVGLAPAYGAVVALGLLVGFLVAAGLKRVLKPFAPIAYPLAGAAAIGLALSLMSMQFYGTTPIAGARGPLGFALQCLAGGLGGVVFSALSRKR